MQLYSLVAETVDPSPQHMDKNLDKLHVRSQSSTRRNANLPAAFPSPKLPTFMSRAAPWASRARLLAKLRPYAAAGATEAQLRRKGLTSMTRIDFAALCRE